MPDAIEESENWKHLPVNRAGEPGALKLPVLDHSFGKVLEWMFFERIRPGCRAACPGPGLAWISYRLEIPGLFHFGDRP